MKKRWTAALLALTLCAAEILPAAAAENAGSALQAEDVQTVDDIPEEAEEIVEELLPQTGIESETELSPDNVGEFSEDGLTIDLSGASDDSMIDLSGAADGSVIDLSETADGARGELPTDTAADLWSTAPVSDTETAEIPIDAEHFPDGKFRDYLTTTEYTVEYKIDNKTAYKKVRIDTDENGSLSADEIAAVAEIDVIGKGISDLTGIAYFTALTTLYCDNNVLTTLDVSQNTMLKTLTCAGNLLSDLDLNSNPKLISFVCSDNQLTALDLSKNKSLQDLRCAGNRLQTLDLSCNSKLTWLDCSENQLSTLDVSKHTSLAHLFCSSNQLTSLNVSGSTSLEWLVCNNNQLTELDVTDVLNVRIPSNGAVNLLNCADNRLTSLDVSNKSYFKGLICSNNAITELDLSTDPDLRQLECANNALTKLDVTKNTKLQTLDCSGNQLTSLDLSKLSVTETTALPNCSGQDITISLTETASAYQADLNPIIGNSSLLRLTKEELLADSCTAKSVKGSLFLLTQEGELADGILSFTKGAVPETIELACATGYKKNAGETDILLEIHLHCHTHTYVELSKTEPGCTENGLLRERCTVCGTITETVLPAAGHSYQKDPEKCKDPTCTEGGYLAQTCTVCGDTVNQPLPAAGHSYRMIKTMPTCEEDGSMYQQCSVCGEKKADSETPLPARGHNFVSLVETAVTCEKDGYKLEKCSRCGIQRETTSPATGHKFAFVEEYASVCSAKGRRTEQCTVCGKYQYIELPLAAHEYVQIERIAPTCLSDGILRERCRNCYTTLETTLPATGHTYGEFAVTRAATIFAEGIKSRTCSVCGNVETETIPKLDGTVELTTGSLPVQVKEKVSVQSLVTGLTKGDYVVSWKSDDPKIATISEDGTITAKKNGTVNISVITKSGAAATLAVKVQKDPVATEAITGLKKNVSLKVGKTLRLKPVLTPISSQQGISYKSSNKKVAKVSAKGVIKGLKEGTAKITVKSGNQKFVIKLTVTAATQEIRNVPAKKTLRKGKTFRLKPRLAMADSSLKFSFRSSNKKVASVNAKGKIKARRKGVAKITVRAGSLKKVCRITVK